MSNLKYAPGTRQRAIVFAKRGHSNDDISHLMGIPHGTIRSWTAGHHPPQHTTRRAREDSTVLRAMKAGRHWWWKLTGWGTASE